MSRILFIPVLEIFGSGGSSCVKRWVDYGIPGAVMTCSPRSDLLHNLKFLGIVSSLSGKDKQDICS